MLRTRFTELARIRHPVVQAAMTWVTNAELVAAVSRAGGLGSIGPNAGGWREPTRDVAETAERLRTEIRRTRALTAEPFAVNVPIGRGDGRAYSDACIRVAVEERVPIVSTVMGSPDVYTSALQEVGIVVLHAVASVRHAVKAEAAGVDAVIAESFDGGGHSGFDEIPLAALVPQVLDAVDIPVLAAGGIVDGRGFAAALALGADGIYMGTRFMATTECNLHPDVKQAIVAATDASTLSWGRTAGVARTLRNRFALAVREMERSSASPEQIQQFIRDHASHLSRGYAGLVAGDLEEGEIWLGAGAGMIREVLPAGEVVERVVGEAETVLERVRALWAAGAR